MYKGWDSVQPQASQEQAAQPEPMAAKNRDERDPDPAGPGTQLATNPAPQVIPIGVLPSADGSTAKASVDQARAAAVGVAETAPAKTASFEPKTVAVAPPAEVETAEVVAFAPEAVSPPTRVDSPPSPAERLLASDPKSNFVAFVDAAKLASGLSAEDKIRVAEALVDWQEKASEADSKGILSSHGSTLLDVVDSVLRATDQELSALDGPDYTHLVPALLLSALFLTLSPMAEGAAAQQYSKQVFGLLREAQSQRECWCEPGLTGALSLGSVRLGVVKNLFRSVLRLNCLHDAQEALPHAFAYVVDCRHIPALRSLAVAVLCRHFSKSPAALASYAAEVLDALSTGSTELAFVLSDNSLANLDIARVGPKLSTLLEQLPSDLLIRYFKRAVQTTPEYLVQCVPRIVDDLFESSNRNETLSVLTSLAAKYPGAVAHLLDKIRAACLLNRLFTPYMKLLCSCSSYSRRTAHFAIREFIALLRSTEKLSESDLAALVGGLNVLKDSCPCSDIFQADTLTLLERAARHNWEAYVNLRKWNRGEWAKLGDLEAYLRQGELVRPRGCLSGGGKMQATRRSSVAVEIAPKPLSVDTDMISRMERRPPLKIPPSDDELLSAGKANQHRRPSLMVAVQVSLESLGKNNAQKSNPLAPLNSGGNRRPSFLDPIEYGADSAAPTRSSFLTPLAPDPLSILAPIDYHAEATHTKS